MNIFITGAANGLGRELALHYLESGCRVYGVSIEDYSEEVFAKYAGKTFFFSKLSIGDFAAVAKSVEDCINKFGSIDVLINNAGLKFHRSPDSIKIDDYANVLNTNLLAQINIINLVIPSMIKNKSGTIINIASRAAVEFSYVDGIAYGPSKAGFYSYSQLLAKYLESRKVSVHVLCPPTFSTDDYKILHPELNHNKFLSSKVVIKAIDDLVYAKSFITNKVIYFYSIKSWVRTVLSEIVKYVKLLPQVKYRWK